MNVDANPRGYAFKAFERSYERLCSWNWFAAQKSAGIAPSSGEYIHDGLLMFDAMTAGVADIEAVARQTTDDIVSMLSKSLYANGKGRIGYRRKGDGTRHDSAYVKYDLLDRDGLKAISAWAYEEPGFQELEDWDTFTRRVQRLALAPLEQAVVAAYVELGGEASQSEVGRRLGVSRFSVHEALIRIRAKDRRTL